MKIIFFIHSLNAGGAERVTSHMANNWANKANDVTILTIAPVAERQYPLSEKVNHLSLEMDKSSGNVIDALANNIKRVVSLKSEIKKQQADIVISMMSEANVLTALACRKLPTKSIGSERIHPEQVNIGFLWNTLRRFSYRYLDLLVTQTKQTEEWIKKHTSVQSTTTIPNPLVLPIPSGAPIVTPDISEQEFLILGVGRLTHQKQFTHLITAFASVCEDHPDWTLAIIGEGKDHATLSALIETHNLTTRVRLIGRVGNVADWYNRADIFALTSLTEGFPNVLIEAMAHSTAVISYNCPTGPGEIITHGVNGLLVEPNNTKQFTSTLAQLIGDPELRSELAHNATMTKSTYDIELIMNQWETAMNTLLTVNTR